MKKIRNGLMVMLALATVAVFAASVEMKTSGPSGQGSLIYWAPSTGKTNLVMTTAGVSVINGDGSGLTNTAAGQLTGNIAVARMTNALPSAGSYIGGNIPVAAITNAAGSVGASIGGNVPVAAITNAAKTVGASIGGNIPIAAITNALSPTLYSGMVTNIVSGTNVWVVLNGVIVSVTILP